MKKLLFQKHIVLKILKSSQLDAEEYDDKNEKDALDWEISTPRRDQVHKAIEILHLCCLY